ncbi:hypothetical protein DI005_19245 [Prauserella sp. PE36]|uniref:hypothetical protein n=1 Tax=Prauserella sp. PE36 TaxID=1504709 RepID=UPI000D8EADEE|nr:hypothetical protein [Prauserella sp. PE36]PXY23498.1 hypothetical protein BAY59_27945 [Prauserella coralliicola]RBM18342.1 hypothetical protein DI005_19245 [Prauserella sp. PE36]
MSSPRPPAPDPTGARPGTGGQPRGSLGLVAAVLLVLAAGLTAFASFQPLFTGRISSPGQAGFELSITAWGVDTDAPQQEGGVPSNGLPLSVAAGLLAGAAVLTLLAVSRRAAGLVAAIGAAFLTGAGWVVFMQVLSWIDTFRSTENGRGPFQVDTSTSIGLGTWLLAGALVLAIAGTVLALRIPKTRAEPVTPRYGFPAPMGPPPPSSPDPGVWKPAERHGPPSAQ